MKNILLATGLLCAASAAYGQVGPIAYDGFSGGPFASLDGYAGGTGWTDAWRDTQGSLLTSVGGPASGLSYLNLMTSPGSATSQRGQLPDMVAYVRSYPPVTGSALYVSCLMRVDATRSQWYVVRFGSWPNHVELGIPMGHNVFGLGIGDGFYAASTVPATTGQTHLLVMEVVHTSSGGTTYSLYVDPVPGAPRPAVASAFRSSLGAYAFGTVAYLHGEGGVTIDELRIGTTWSSVLPVVPACGTADFNNDGDVGTDQDIESFFACLAGNCCATCGSSDFDADGNVGTDQDIEAFFRVLAGGTC